MKKKLFQFRKKKAQTQLLMVMGMGLAMMAASISMLENSRRVKTEQIHINWQSEMRTAIEIGVKLASNLYRVDAGCDPVLLADKLGRIDTTGSVTPNKTKAQLTVSLNTRTYTVSFGAVSRLPWENAEVDPSLQGNGWRQGTIQDAIIEVWTTRPGTNVTVVQQAVLLNNCTYPCNTPDGEICVTSTNRGIAYGTITSPFNYPKNAPISFACGNQGGRAVGVLRLVDPVSGGIPTTIDTRDLMILKNYLRGGDTQGSSSAILGGDGTANSATSSCADYNFDGLVNEVDQGIMEKYLRGYLFWTSTREFSQ